MNRSILLLFVVLIIGSCAKKMKSVQLTANTDVNEVAVVRSETREKCNCDDALHYLPDDRYPEYQDLKTVKVNFHFPNASNRQYNWTGDDAVTFARKLVRSCNHQLINNIKMNLPVGNDTPVYDANYRIELTKDPNTESGYAVYEDIDDENWF